MMTINEIIEECENGQAFSRTNWIKEGKWIRIRGLRESEGSGSLCWEESGEPVNLHFVDDLRAANWISKKDHLANLERPSK